MASIDEVMSYRNRDPKWMTDSIETEEVLKKKHKDPTWMTGSKGKEAASQPQAPKAPKPSSAIPQMNFKVHMCCEKCEEKAKEEASEVPGVMSVITDPRRGLVTVLGRADSAAVLKKLKKHVDKKAMVWPEDLPVPKVAAVAPTVSGGGMNVGNGERRMETGEKGEPGGKMDASGMNRPRMAEMMRPDPRTVDPRMAETMRLDPRMVDPRMAETMRPDPRMAATMRSDPRMVDLRMAETMRRPDSRLVDPRMVETMRPNPRMVDPRMVETMRPDPRMVDPREMRNAEVREGWVVDPREMRGGDMRERRGVEMMREMGPPAADPRMVDPREAGGGVHERKMQQHRQLFDPREMREYEYAPADPRTFERSREMGGGGERSREMRGGGASGDRREMAPMMDPRTFDIREMQGRGGSDPQEYAFSDPRTMHAPPPELYYGSRSQEADLRGYQPNNSYFSDYRPSQSYPANYSTSDLYYGEDDMSPYYMNQAVY